MQALLNGITRSDAFLSFWETIISGPEEAVGAPLPLEAQLDYVRQTVSTAANRVVSSLQGIPEQIRFESGQAANVAEDTVATIRRNLPEGITEAFVPEEADTIQMWNNLPRFGNVPAMSEVEQATLMAPANTVPRSYAENVERLMDTIDREFEAAQRQSAAAWEQQWAGIKERSMMKVRLSDIRVANNRGNWRLTGHTELAPSAPEVEMTTMGTIPEDCGALDLQYLMLREPEVTESITRLTAELKETYMAMQDIAGDGMGILSDGTVLTTAELPGPTATMSSIEHQEIFAAGKESFRELEQVTVQLEDDAAAVAEAYESVFTGENPMPLSMSHWDAPSMARQAEAAGVLDEFSEQLRVIEPIDVYDPAPPPQLVADFQAEALEAEAFLEPAAAAAVEEGAIAAGVAVPADAAAGTIVETVVGAVVEAGWGLAGAVVAGVGVTAVSLAFMGMIESNNRSRGDAPAPPGKPGIQMNPEIRHTSAFGAMMAIARVNAEQVRLGALTAAHHRTEAAHYDALNAAYGHWVEYIHRIWRRRAMADPGRRFVVMDPQTGLFRYATVASYSYRATIWSVAGDEHWRPLRFCNSGVCPGIVPQVSLPPGQAAWGSVVWPPENQDFDMRMEGVSYALHIESINRIHGAPMTAGQLEWNRRASASPAAGRFAAEATLAAFFHGPATRQKFGLYKHAVATRHAMHGQHYVLMDPNSGLWRVARCTDYRMNPTRWTEATTMVAPMGEVTWPPLGESWRFGPWTMPPWVYAHKRVGYRAVGHTVTSYRLIHHAPLTPAQTAWNHRMIEMMRLRLGQRVVLQVVRLTNQALVAALAAHGSSDPANIVTSNQMPLGGFSNAPATVAGLDATQLNLALRKQVSDHLFSEHEIIQEWSHRYSLATVQRLVHAAFVARNTDTQDYDMRVRDEQARAVRRRLGGSPLREGDVGPDGTVYHAADYEVGGRFYTRRRLAGSTGLGQSLIPQQGGLSESTLPAAHRPIVMGGMTPGQLNRELRRLVDLGTFPAGAIQTAFGAVYGHDNVVTLVAAAERSAVTNRAAFHTAVRREQRPANRRAADAIEANIPGGPGVRVQNIRPVVSGGDTGHGRPGAGALVPGGAINVRPANIIGEAGGHHHRHRATPAMASAFSAAVFPDVVSDYHFVPVWNPADFDKGISSHSLAATGSAVATTQSTTQSTSTVAAPVTSSFWQRPSFWHTVGQAYNVGATVASYYMGNDPCRVASGRRRMVASAESELAVQTDETFEEWNARNAALIVSRGGTTTQLARAMFNRMEPPAQTQADCVQPAVDTLEESHAAGPETVEIDWPGAQAECELETVQLGSGNTEASKQGPKATTTASVAKPKCGQPGGTQDYTIYVIGLILLVALAAIMMN